MWPIKIQVAELFRRAVGFARRLYARADGARAIARKDTHEGFVKRSRGGHKGERMGDEKQARGETISILVFSELTLVYTISPAFSSSAHVCARVRASAFAHRTNAITLTEEEAGRAVTRPRHRTTRE